MSLVDELTAAAAGGNTRKVRQLLREGAEVNGLNRFGHTALQVMMMGSTPVAQALLENGARTNVVDGYTGSTPLHDAARSGFLDTVRLLVEYKADPRARDKRYSRPVDVARDAGHRHVVAFLESL
ncbi:hypothetical protein Q5P01_025319 [Channa striata]|uniref:Uncharacterized protein n=1 Tax=Channa striata TaxID=64152 RepID=A0AA88IWI4_CHASR|nr:hypothetical protein Q5P01_025319 [Channa striata]